MNQIIKKNREQIVALCKKYFVKELYVFGSVTRNDFNEKSDIDFLYKIDVAPFEDSDKNECDYVDNLLQFENSLKTLLNRNIDLIPAIPIRNEYLKQSIEESKQLLYAA